MPNNASKSTSSASSVTRSSAVTSASSGTSPASASVDNFSAHKPLSRKVKLEIFAVLLVIISACGYLAWDILNFGPLSQLFSDRDRLIGIVNDLGPLGPLAYIALQVLQTVVAPIPGNLVGGIGGYIFGWWGILWTSIGSTLGAGIVFWLSRKFGRKLIEKFVKKESLDKFDFILGRRSSLLPFIIFLIPGLPDDTVCYLAGLTDIPIRRLLVLFAVGRLPAVVVNNYIGAGLSEGNVNAVAIIAVVTAILLIIIYLQQENIIRLLGKEYHTDDRREILKMAGKDLIDDGAINSSIIKKSSTSSSRQNLHAKSQTSHGHPKKTNAKSHNSIAKNKK